MTQIKAGSKVAISYVGTLDNGRIFSSTPDDEPLVFAIGAGEVFPALESTVRDMRVGETRNVVIAASDAYGPRLAENVVSLDRSMFPSGKEIRIGQKLAIEFSGKSSRVMMVTEVSDSAVTLDGNHPLAGLDLTFAVRLDRIG